MLDRSGDCLWFCLTETKFWIRLNHFLFTCSGKDVYRKVQGRDRPTPSAVISITGLSVLHLSNCPSNMQLSIFSSLPDGLCEDILTKKEEEERRIAELGRPILGEHVRLEVTIEESYEFKVGELLLKNI